MVRLKGKQLMPVSAINSEKLVDSANSSNALADLSVFEEDDWVLVKKQRVTILIPSAPSSKKPTVDDNNPDELQGEISKEMVNATANASMQNSSEVNPIVKNDKPTASSKMVEVQLARKPQLSRTVLALPKPTALNRREPSLCRAGVDCRRWSSVEPLRLFPPRVDRMLRASMLERKLARAGGLNRWLASLGLEQFIRVFKLKNVGKFQLVNLSMEKLKDMGAHAVGPRRKLMHAIDCLCQPYCFQTP